MRTTWFGSALILASMIGFAPAFAYPDVDWKAFALVTYSSGVQVCFYDEKGIEHEAHGILRFWSKCLAKSDIENFPASAPYFRAVMDMTSQRVAHHYIAPYAQLEKMNFNVYASVLLDEALADVSDLAPKERIYYELDCGQKRIRELSVFVSDSQNNQPTAWSYIAPETNASVLYTLLCQKA